MTTIDLILQQVEQVNFYKNNLKLKNYDPLLPCDTMYPVKPWF